MNERCPCRGQWWPIIGWPTVDDSEMYQLFPSVAVISLAEAAASFTGMVCLSQKKLNTKIIKKKKRLKPPTSSGRHPVGGPGGQATPARAAPAGGGLPASGGGARRRQGRRASARGAGQVALRQRGGRQRRASPRAAPALRTPIPPASMGARASGGPRARAGLLVLLLLGLLAPGARGARGRGGTEKNSYRRTANTFSQSVSSLFGEDNVRAAQKVGAGPASAVTLPSAAHLGAWGGLGPCAASGAAGRRGEGGPACAPGPATRPSARPPDQGRAGC